VRVTSHCASHPSREATVRCRACHKWLCELCVRRFGGFVYCGRLCHLRGTASGMLGPVGRAARRRLHPAWVATAVAAALVALALPIVRLSAVLLGEAASAPSSAAEIPLTATVVDTSASELDLSGPPGAGVLVVAEGRPLTLTTLDDDGHARLDLRDLDTMPGTVDLVVLPSAPLQVEIPAVATSDRTATSGEVSERRLEVRPLERVTPPVGAAPNAVIARVEPPPVPTEATRPTPRPAPATPLPSDGRTPPVLHLVTDAGPRLALTFDGDSVSRGTSELLDLLDDLDLRVTLFVSGRFIEREPSLVRRAVLAGHEIGNHTYRHPHLTTYSSNRRHDMRPGVTRDRFVDELRRTEEVFRRATGRSMAPLWRAPYGEENATLRRWALEEGYLHVRWSSLGGASLDSHDWVDDEHSPLYRDPDRMARRLLGFPRLEGGIVLMHLGSERPTPPWTALPGLVEALAARDIEVVQVSELLESSGTWRRWLDRARRAPRLTADASGQSPPSISGSASRR
jgi:peptidoglycan/xylan/chitin deacetylase (PgdA/CDA1 family)